MTCIDVSPRDMNAHAFVSGIVGNRSAGACSMHAVDSRRQTRITRLMWCVWVGARARAFHPDYARAFNTRAGITCVAENISRNAKEMVRTLAKLRGTPSVNSGCEYIQHRGRVKA